MSVIHEIGSYKVPLRNRRSVDICSKVVEVSDFGETGGDGCDRVEYDMGVVFSDVVSVWWCGGVEVVRLSKAERDITRVSSWDKRCERCEYSLEAEVSHSWHVLLIRRP